MSRVIKFRAWDKISGMFCSVSWACGIDNSGFIYPCETKPKTDIVLMQFTGLLDKNGKEIYEGDVLKGSWEHEEGNVFEFDSAQVLWDKRTCSFAIPETFSKETKVPYQNYRNFMWQIRSCEIIGNIYENSDLLTN